MYRRLLGILLLALIAAISLASQAAQDLSTDRLPRSGTVLLARLLAEPPAGARTEPLTLPSTARSLLPGLPVEIPFPPPNRLRPFPINPVSPGFQSLVGAAGIIFSGRVAAIGRTSSASGPGPASTAVTFQVEHALRGVSTGQTFTIQEWAGLWSGRKRYYVGERLLLFLYSPSKLGLTSPVAGTLGRFAVDSRGRIVISARHMDLVRQDATLGGKTVVPYSDFALAVERSTRQE